jgi:hypothetical protein
MKLSSKKDLLLIMAHNQTKEVRANKIISTNIMTGKAMIKIINSHTKDLRRTDLLIRELY